MILLYCIISALTLPSILIFRNNGDNSYAKSFLDTSQISNLGFATTFCKDTSMIVGKLQIDCPSGVVSEMISYGLSPPYAEIWDACMPNADT